MQQLMLDPTDDGRSEMPALLDQNIHYLACAQCIDRVIWLFSPQFQPFAVEAPSFEDLIGRRRPTRIVWWKILVFDTSERQDRRFAGAGCGG